MLVVMVMMETYVSLQNARKCLALLRSWVTKVYSAGCIARPIAVLPT